jgi:hypothetical protein
LEHLEKAKRTYRNHGYLRTSINLAWQKLHHYYNVMDSTPVYAAALFLHPKFRFDYFRKRWDTKALGAHQLSTLNAIRELYTKQCKITLTEETLNSHNIDPQEDIFETLINAGATLQDEFEVYLNGLDMYAMAHRTCAGVLPTGRTDHLEFPRRIWTAPLPPKLHSRHLDLKASPVTPIRRPRRTHGPRADDQPKHIPCRF